jgi:hypothetical protein
VSAEITHVVTRAWLLGRWQLLRCESPLEIQPGTRMEFRDDSHVAYMIPAAGRDLHIALRWQLEADVLHTAHEDGSNPVRVRVAHGDGDILRFDFGGSRAWFVRQR